MHKHEFFGTPFYWLIRHKYAGARRTLARHYYVWSTNVYMRDACAAGTPKLSFDPHVNQWTRLDPERWKGFAALWLDEVASSCLCFWGVSIIMGAFFAKRRKLGRWPGVRITE